MPTFDIVKDPRTGKNVAIEPGGSSPLQREQLGLPTQYTYGGETGQFQIIEQGGHPVGTTPIVNVVDTSTGKATAAPLNTFTPESRQLIMEYERSPKNEPAPGAQTSKFTAADVSRYIALGAQQGAAGEGSGKLLTPEEFGRAQDIKNIALTRAATEGGTFLNQYAIAMTTDPFYASHITLKLAQLGVDPYFFPAASNIGAIRHEAYQSEFNYFYQVEQAKAAKVDPLQFALVKSFTSPVLLTVVGAAITGGLLGAGSFYYPTATNILGKGIMYVGGTALMLKSVGDVQAGRPQEVLRTAEAVAIAVPVSIYSYKATYSALSGVDMSLGLRSPLRYEKVVLQDTEGKDFTVSRNIYWQTSQASEPYTLIGKENTGSIMHGWKFFSSDYSLSPSTLGRVGFTEAIGLEHPIATRTALANYKFFTSDTQAQTRLGYELELDKLFYRTPSGYRSPYPEITRLQNPTEGTKAAVDWAKKWNFELYGSASVKTQLPAGKEYYFHDWDFQATGGRNFDKAISDMIGRQAKVGNVLTAKYSEDLTSGTKSVQFFNPAGQKVFDIHPLQYTESMEGLGFRYGQTPIMFKGVRVMPISESGIRAGARANLFPSGMPALGEEKAIFQDITIKEFFAASTGRGSSLAAGLRSTYNPSIIEASRIAAGGSAPIRFSSPMPSLPAYSGAGGSMASFSIVALPRVSLFSSSMGGRPSASPSRLSSPSVSLSSISSPSVSRLSSPSSPSSPSLSSLSSPSSPSISSLSSPSSRSSPSLSSLSSPSSPSSPSLGSLSSFTFQPPVPITLPAGGWIGGLPGLSGGRKRKYAYTPSLIALFKGITTPKAPRQRMFSGLEIRPMLAPKGRNKNLLWGGYP